MKINIKKCLTYFFITIFLIILLCFSVYKFALPALVSNDFFIKTIKNAVGKQLDVQIVIDKPRLSTGKSISFTLKELQIYKNNKILLKIKNIDTLFDLQQILTKKIIVKKMLAEEIYADVDGLSEILPKSQKEKKKKSMIFLDFYNVLLGVEKAEIKYYTPAFLLNFKSKHMMFDRTQSKKYLHFDFDFSLKRDEYNIKVSANDANKFFMENGTAYIVNFPIEIAKSKIVLNAFMDRKRNYEFNISATDFSAGDIADIVKSNIFIANGRQMLEPINNVRGKVDFKLKLDNKNNTLGNIKIKSVDFKVIPLLNMPVRITGGFVDIGNKDINFKDFKGYYNNLTQNSIKLHGKTTDYKNKCETTIISDIFITNDFFKNYLSKMLGASIELVGDAGSRLILTSKNNSVDILWYFLLREKEGFKFGEQSLVLNDYKTLFKVDLSIVKNILKINTINYYNKRTQKRHSSCFIRYRKFRYE